MKLKEDWIWYRFILWFLVLELRSEDYWFKLESLKGNQWYISRKYGYLLLIIEYPENDYYPRIIIKVNNDHKRLIYY